MLTVMMTELCGYCERRRPVKVQIMEAEGDGQGDDGEDDEDINEDEENRCRRLTWTEEDDIRLVSAWLNNSIDPLAGNCKKGDVYWKSVTEEYNSNSPPNRRRQTKHCKDHWGKSNKKVTVNGRQHKIGYHLVDGIYPEWAAFVKSITAPQSARDKLFARKQEAARKDVEWAFGALQSRFTILRYATRYWHRSILSEIMYACIILHNMIVEDERVTYTRAGRYDLNYD